MSETHFLVDMGDGIFYPQRLEVAQPTHDPLLTHEQALIAQYKQNKALQARIDELEKSLTTKTKGVELVEKENSELYSSNSDLVEQLVHAEASSKALADALESIKQRSHKARYDEGHRCDYRVDVDANYQQAREALAKTIKPSVEQTCSNCGSRKGKHIFIKDVLWCNRDIGDRRMFSVESEDG